MNTPEKSLEIYRKKRLECKNTLREIYMDCSKTPARFRLNLDLLYECPKITAAICEVHVMEELLGLSKDEIKQINGDDFWKDVFRP